MGDTNIKLLVLWYHKCKLFYCCHRDSSAHYSYLHKLIGFPTILINVFNSSSLLSNYSSISGTFIIVIATLSVFSAMLTAAQTHFEFIRLKDQHAKYMMEYSKILFSIEKIIILHKNNTGYVIDPNVIDNVLNNIERLRETYIHFPEKIWKSNNLLYKNKLEKLDVNTSDSINILLSTIKNKKDLSFLNDSSKQSEIITYDNNETNDNQEKGTNSNQEKEINSDQEIKIDIIKNPLR